MIKRLFACVLLLAMLMPACHAQTGTLRALSVGIARYDDGRVRTGGVNSTQGMYDALSRAFGVYGSFQGDLALDTTKQRLLELIEETFSEAGAADVSLLYINAHGGSQAGVSWIETREGARLTAPELERALRKIRGRVVLLIDCCASGGFTGFAGAYADGFCANFLASNKYMALVSCALDENSYRVSAKDAQECNVSTAFSRAVCEGLGWDLINDRSTSLKADADRDRSVSLSELYSYVLRRAGFYLSGSSEAVQTASLYPEACPFVIASRGSREE